MCIMWTVLGICEFYLQVLNLGFNKNVAVMLPVFWEFKKKKLKFLFKILKSKIFLYKIDLNKIF